VDSQSEAEARLRRVWVTEQDFHGYGGTTPEPATFLSGVASRTARTRLGIAMVISPLHNP
jgi:alkanesulfonate monooxygenase SsuD/methylene tetrahydromethanopterin reductase-like flavin-dependent oxidoreductase (luciferase family)